jgi:hypothetical protein
MDVNNFEPFYAEVWGTVSDWLMLIVTTFTLYFLYKNLEAQKKALQTQIEVSEVEAKNHAITDKQYLRSILPIITFEQIILEQMFEQYYINFKVYQNPAFSIQIIDKQDAEYNRMPPVPSNLPIGYSFNVGVTEEQKSEHNLRKLFTLLFSDVDGNTYTQEVSKVYGEYTTSYPVPFEG